MLIMALLVIAAAQAVAAALGVLLLLAIVYGVFVCPRETFGLLALCIVVGLFDRHPLACLGAAALVIVAGLIRQRW